jgi:hypothetical protein
MISPVAWGAITIVVAGGAFVAGLVGLRTGRSPTPWSAVLALAGAGLAAGALLVQDDPGAASWFIALPVGAALSVAHGRALFPAGGPFRT